jgi:hypothetical protein
VIFGIRIRDKLGREMVFSTMQPKRLTKEFFNKICQKQTWRLPAFSLGLFGAGKLVPLLQEESQHFA